MPRRKSLKKHSVRANLHVKELTRSGSSLNLEIYANKEKIGTLILGSGSLFLVRQETAEAQANSVDAVC